MGGTRSLSFDGKGFAGSFWWETAFGQSLVASEEQERAFTVVVNHEFDIAENLAISSVCLITRLRVTAPLPIEDALRLGIEDKGHGEQALDPF
jgi:hypothetical protein